MSEVLQAIIKSISNAVRFHKKKFLAFSLCAFLFFILLFPYDDLGDLVTSEIYEQSQRQVFLQFETLGWQIFPAPGIKLGEANLILSSMPPLKIDSLAISPNIASFLAFNKGVNANIQGLFGGDLTASLKLRSKKPDKMPQIISLSIEQLNVLDLLQWLEQDIPIKGKLNLELASELDFSFVDQPKGEFSLNISKVSIPPYTVATPFGDLPLPSLNIKSLDIQGAIKDGSLIFNKVTIGKPGDPIEGKLEGSLGLRLSKRGSEVSPRFSNYEFNFSLNLASAEASKLSLFLGFLGKEFKTKSGSNLNIAMKLTGPRFGPPPKMSRLTKKL